MRTIALAAGLLVLGAILFFSLGALRWKQTTQQLLVRLDSGATVIKPLVFDPRELTDLPPPVQRYFNLVLTPGQKMVRAANLAHEGEFNMSEQAEQWKVFGSDQRVHTLRPGFVWNAEIAMAPGVPIRVHDAYVLGEGILHATIGGLVDVANLRGGGEIAHGELMRYLAEAVWYPTALLPSQGVRWEAIDERSARATLTDQDVTVSLRFLFSDTGLIEGVRADARGRTEGKKIVQSPWGGRFWDYQTQDGMRVPQQGQVAWLSADGEKPYWRGRIKRISFEFAG